jgi:hypothetical protein
MTDSRSEGSEIAAGTGAVSKRQAGTRPPDIKETVAELTARAHEISKEAGSRMSVAVKELIAAAAGMAGFALESARDLVQFMVRRGQMTQEEADILMTEVEATQPKRKVAPPSGPRVGKSAPAAATKPSPAAAAGAGAASKKSAKKAAPKKSAAKKPAAKKPAAKKPAAKKPAAKTKKSPAKKR